ncbi:hypothetical protein M405DRAFT_842599 [Rhizopogon salebrosus TDB-379]|nr:hypothetical protein M405DRAFT_842599 [Rhizopogon salebrosus TDB-379]
MIYNTTSSPTTTFLPTSSVASGGTGQRGRHSAKECKKQKICKDQSKSSLNRVSRSTKDTQATNLTAPVDPMVMKEHHLAIRRDLWDIENEAAFLVHRAADYSRTPLEPIKGDWNTQTLARSELWMHEATFDGREKPDDNSCGKSRCFSGQTLSLAQMSVSRPRLILSVRGYDAKPVDGSDLGVDIRLLSAYQVQSSLNVELPRSAANEYSQTASDLDSAKSRELEGRRFLFQVRASVALNINATPVREEHVTSGPNLSRRREKRSSSVRLAFHSRSVDYPLTRPFWHKSDDTAYLQQRKGEKQSPISEKEDSFQENRVFGDRYRGNSFWWYHKNPKGDQCENNLQS